MVAITFVFLVYFIVALLVFLRRPNDGFALFSRFSCSISAPRLPLLHSPSLCNSLGIPHPGMLFPCSSAPCSLGPCWSPSWCSIPTVNLCRARSLFLAVIAFFLTAAWGLFPNAFFEIASPLGIFGAVGAVVLTGASLYVQSWRYRHHFSPIQRQQAKWFVFALAVFLCPRSCIFVLSIQSDRA